MLAHCNFQRIEDGANISVECENYESAKAYAHSIVDCPVINITVTEKPKYTTIYKDYESE